MMPDDWKAQIGGMDAILFGAVGWPAPCPTMSRCGAAC
jgi:tartrate dehydrogenase/decarboxylase/D-malate dehydrogenase